ncbi:MAG: hypothetical protein KGQ59_12170 [Bdellovibrionales bacterium]|nr:hypothetical protein [Bdellovibrionales bacterium]
MRLKRSGYWRRVLNRNKVKLCSFGVVTGAIAFLSACQSSDFSLEPPQLAEASRWSEIYLKQTCDAIAVLADCPGQNGFHIDTQGRLSSGPEYGPAEPLGVLTALELSSVLNAANRAAMQNLSAPYLNCLPWLPTAGETGVQIRLHDEDGVSTTIYQKSSAFLQFCFRGDQALAEALYRAVNPLVNLYGPRPTPSPSPTAVGVRSW